MSAHAPQARFASHEVTNQPPEFGGLNLFLGDPALREAALREGGTWVEAPLAALGQDMGSDEVMELGEAANRHPPELTAFDRYGRRIDEVRYHPAYHALMELAMRHRIHAIAWDTGRPGGHVAHAAMLALATQAEAGTMCPISMTYAAVPALRRQPDLAATWVPRIVQGRYDPTLRRIADKAGVTLGMAMTEKQGGSDVRANTTAARPLGAGGPGMTYELTGHKWFCSAPMSDAFLTLAQTAEGLSCFLVPRITPDGGRNAIHLMRLKDKLGNRANASAEIEYHGAWASMVGPEGHGIETIIDMVHHTRLDTMASTLGLMRMALAQAAHHARHRRAFQKRLVDHAVMRGVLADLALDYEAAVVLVMRVARAFDAAEGPERVFARLAVAVGKYWLCKRAPSFVAKCMECLGGAGYIEDSMLPRLYREAPLNGIWEGAGNVIALDVLRTLAREPLARAAFRSEIAAAKGGNAILDATMAGLEASLSHANEAQARLVAERLALVLQGALLVRHAPAFVAEAFCATRLGGESGRSYGTLPPGVAIEPVLARIIDGTYPS
ncbi:putative acyl-CoA dehydrogenase AidB [Rhodovastum atsumiense]|uniref:Isovaleryl-CoA dehydrogenase n=1 Tax=Rhodovastum atsumiense TaxID=504468 RepID=A0A5M6J0A6_9PROT|nr:isovaleryl-CoA dehydrogenase [Rhodovastum atsumiense]KAA5613028.1 isovaleryl-CoA dehydrogenase [Rhodovastum atsumiense]CAH2600119.1 putative acyl-CoA dehydrogenase AidB [Rhodovastum atsumiense]